MISKAFIYHVSSKLKKNIFFFLLLSFFCLTNVAGQGKTDCLQLKNYKKDEKALKTAWRKNIGTFGAAHPNTIQKQFELANLYQEMGLYDNAEKLLTDAFNTSIQTNGNIEENTVNCQLELAKFYMATGDYLNAKKWAEAALGASEKIPENQVLIAESSAILAEVYQALGQHDEAEDLLEHALKINNNSPSDNHVAIIKLQSELALLHYTLGKYEKAKELFELVIANDFKGTDEQNIDLTKYQSNLANIYFELENYEKAKEILQLVLKTDSERLCVNHPKIARHQHNLSKVYFRLGDYEKAKDLSLEALESNLEHYGAEHPIVVENQIDLALIYQVIEMEIGKELSSEYIPGISKTFDGRGRKLMKAIGYISSGQDVSKAPRNIYIKILNAFPSVKDSYESYGEDLRSMNYENHQNAKLLWGHIIANTVKDIYKHCRLLPAEERLMYIQKHADIFDTFYSFVTRSQDPELSYQVMYASSAIKSIDLDYSRSLRRVISKSKDKELIHLYNEYIARKKLLNEAYLLTQQELEQREWNIKKIEKEINQLESRLLKNKRIKVFSGNIAVKDLEDSFFFKSLFGGALNALAIAEGDYYDSEQLSPSRPQAATKIQKMNSGLREIDFIRFNYHDGKSFTDSMLYAAMIYDIEINSAGQSELSGGFNLISLTDEKTLAPLFEIQEGDYMPAYMRSEEKRKQVYELIWKPLEPHMAGVQHVRLSPVNLLYRLDFGVLQNDDGTYLNQMFELHYTSVLRDRHMVAKYGGLRNRKPYKDALLIGNIAYDKDQINQRQEEENKYDEAIAQDNTRGRIRPLPGTLEEVKAIESICQEGETTTDLLTADNPTEDRLQYISGASPEIIHIATHGFSLNPLYDDKRKSGDNLVLQDRIRYADNPLQRCGLMLHGANDAWKKRKQLIDPKNDGILTGLEVTELDLRDTRLVVLSACSTGLGSLHDTEGVFGLQRAFKLAGVDEIVVSLWPVDDEITKELMIIFYNNLLNRREPTATALHNAKAEMRKRNPAPHLWAGFILTE